MLQPLNFSLKNDTQKITMIGHALASPIRLTILKLLAFKNMTLKEIADAMKIPLNSLLKHITILEKGELVGTQINYTSKGKSRICYRLTDKLSITLFDPETDYIPFQQFDEYSITIGSYFDFYDLSAPCGMASAKERIDNENDLNVFLSPKRTRAQIIWFTKGLLEYRIPLPDISKLKNLKGIEISFEACSEAPLYNNDYKSDISVFINDKKIGVYTSPGDFGDRKGLLNPDFWPLGLTQYGNLLLFKIDETQSTVNNEFLSFVRLSDLNLKDIKTPYLTMRIGVEANAEHVGGINLFGKKFGDYQQDIVFKYLY